MTATDIKTLKVDSQCHVPATWSPGKAFWSPYIRSDLLAMQMARRWSNEYKKPFVAVAGEFGGYDFASIDLETRVEMKVEGTPLRTGKVCVEYFNEELDAPSGILGTTANVWLHLIADGKKFIAVEYNVPRLMRLVIETGEIKSNGRNSLFKLIPLNIFYEKAEKVTLFDMCEAEITIVNFTTNQSLVKERNSN